MGPGGPAIAAKKKTRPAKTLVPPGPAPEGPAAAAQELGATREELQSRIEEQESSKEALTPVNTQLHEKVRELETANNNLANLCNCTDIATVLLNAGLRVKRFTPATTRRFHVSAGDVGRPLGAIARRFTDEDLLADRELEVFRLIGQGVKTAEIAERLHLSVKTVETFRDRIRQKLDLRHGAELAHCARQWVLENS